VAFSHGFFLALQTYRVQVNLLKNMFYDI